MKLTPYQHNSKTIRVPQVQVNNEQENEWLHMSYLNLACTHLNRQSIIWACTKPVGWMSLQQLLKEADEITLHAQSKDTDTFFIRSFASLVRYAWNDKRACRILSIVFFRLSPQNGGYRKASLISWRSKLLLLRRWACRTWGCPGSTNPRPSHDLFSAISLEP